MRKKLLYICGMGHSGSTVLNLALDQSPQVVGVAQLANLANPFDPMEVPSDARTELEEFWIEVINSVPKPERDLIRKAHQSTAQEQNFARMALSASARVPLAQVT